MRVAACVLGLSLLLCGLPARADDSFAVVDGKLMRGKKPFTVRAVHAPQLASATDKFSDFVPTFAKTGDCGADAMWYDLPGLSADGKTLDPAAVKTVSVISEKAKDTRLALVVRVAGMGNDVAWRKQAAETAGNALKNSTFALYWFDGADAGELAKIFKAAAPKCTVIAPENGDLVSVTEDPAKPDARAVLIDKIPADPWGDTNFLMRGHDDATFTAIDTAMMRPEEKAPYTPDNSLLSEEERKDGFVSLFNGKDLSGWWFYGDDKGGFRVTPEGNIGWVREGGEALISRKRYKDFILRFEIRLFKEGDNSGTYIRAPRAGRQSRLGMEFQQMGDAGKAPDEHVTGAVYDVVPPKVNANKPAGQWNTVEIDFRGPRLKATLNGQIVQDLSFDDNEALKYRNREGFIGLQDHNCPVEWRNIRIKELN